MQFNEAWGHHGQVRHHGRLAKEHVQSLHQVNDRGVLAVIAKSREGLRGVGPFPSVCEGVKLRFTGLAGSLFKEHVIVLVGIEGGIEVNQVNAGVGKRLCISKPFQVVAKKQLIHGRIKADLARSSLQP